MKRQKPSKGRSGKARAGGRTLRPSASAAKGPAPVKEEMRPGSVKGRPKVRPLHDRVLLRRVEEAEQKRGGIIIPDTAKEKPQQAEVVAVGSGRVLEDGSRLPLSLKAGDRVLVGKWSGTEVKIEGNEYLILREDEVLGILA